MRFIEKDIESQTQGNRDCRVLQRSSKLHAKIIHDDKEENFVGFLCVGMLAIFYMFVWMGSFWMPMLQKFFKPCMEVFYDLLKLHKGKKINVQIPMHTPHK
jgi:hypothetical protein